MNKQTAIQKAGSVRELAALLGITHQAIYAWAGNVPKTQLRLLRLLRPQWFVDSA